MMVWVIMRILVVLPNWHGRVPCLDDRNAQCLHDWSTNLIPPPTLMNNLQMR